MVFIPTLILVSLQFKKNLNSKIVRSYNTLTPSPLSPRNVTDGAELSRDFNHEYKTMVLLYRNGRSTSSCYPLFYLVIS